MGGPITNELDGDAYNTIFYIVESPHEAGTIWVGTDDGLVDGCVVTFIGNLYESSASTPSASPEGSML